MEKSRKVRSYCSDDKYPFKEPSFPEVKVYEMIFALICDFRSNTARQLIIAENLDALISVVFFFFFGVVKGAINRHVVGGALGARTIKCKVKKFGKFYVRHCDFIIFN